MTRPTGELTRREIAIRELARGRAVLVVAQKVQATEAEVQALASSFGDWPKSVKGIRAAAAAIEQGDTSWASDLIVPGTEPVPAEPEPVSEPICPAHGQVKCADCSQNGPTCDQCEYYAETGMHWDTCPNRVRPGKPLAELPDDWDAAVVDESAEVPDDLDAVVDRQDIAEAARAVVEPQVVAVEYVVADEQLTMSEGRDHLGWAEQRAQELDETLAEQAAAEEAEEQARADVDPERVMAALADAHSVLARVGQRGFTGGALPGVDEVLAEPVPRLAETLRMSLGELVLGDGQRVHLGWAEVDVRVSPAGLLAALAGDAGTDAVAVDVRAAWEPAAAVAVRRLAAALPPEVA